MHAAPPGVQLLLACVALLNSSVVRVVELAMHLLLQVSVAAIPLLFGITASPGVFGVPASP